ncbi:MAG: ribosomal protein S18-alanine N-acetyltransferase [Thermodesulfobacteriota bacterium]
MMHSDLDQVLEIERSSFPAPWTRSMFQEEMANRNARLVVFLEDNLLVGYLCFWKVLDEAHLMNIAVHPNRRSRGYGTYFMEKLEELCRKDGLKNIILDVGRRNAPARALYRSRGFHSIGFRKNYYTIGQDDAIVMEKRLDDVPNLPSAAEELKNE